MGDKTHRLSNIYISTLSWLGKMAKSLFIFFFFFSFFLFLFELTTRKKYGKVSYDSYYMSQESHHMMNMGK